MGARAISPQGVLSFLGVHAGVLCCKFCALRARSGGPRCSLDFGPDVPSSPPPPFPLLAGLPPSPLEGPKRFPGD